VKLLRVRLHGFGAFNKGLDVAFDPDHLNLVVGRNEAGKSTLMNSIFGVLFGFRDLNQVRKYEPWDDHDAYAGEIELAAEDGRRYRILRDFKNNAARIERLEGEDATLVFEGRADPRSNRDEDLTYYEELGNLLGFKDEAVFRSTVFFGQQSLQTSVSDQIRRLVSGSSSLDYKGALHELHSRYSELTTENPWKSKGRGRGRLIEQTREDLTHDQTQLVQGRVALGRSLELEAEIAALEMNIESAEASVAEEKQALGAHEKLFDLLGRRDETERRYQDGLSRRDNFRRYADRCQEVEAEAQRRYSHFRQVPSDFPEQVRAYAQDQGEMQKELDLLAQERKRLEELRPRPNNRNGVTMGGVLGGAAVLAGALTPVGVVIGAVAGAAGGLLGYNIGRNVGTGFKEERAQIQERIRQLQTSVKARRKRSEDILAAAGSSLLGRDPKDVIAEFRGFQELREERKRLTAAMKALGERDDVERAFQEAARERGGVHAAMEELLTRYPSLANGEDRPAVGVAIERLRAAVQHIHDTTARDRQRLEAARVEIARLGSRVQGNLSDLEENVRRHERRLARYDLERDALKTSIDTLDQCIKDFQEGDVLQLSEEMSGIFAKITGEKYTRIHLGAGMEPIVSRGDAVPISPDSLSQGARDQLYFAMRIAMARHLSRNIRLPLFLDDPFVNFDADRLRITKEVLDHLQDHQVILVTCNRDYEPWTTSILDLDVARAA
jgi:uncharacterized protein YhaN